MQIPFTITRNLPVYTGDPEALTVIAVSGNTETVRVPYSNLTAGIPHFPDAFPGSRDASGREGDICWSSSGIYAFTDAGWGKAPLYAFHWDDLTETTRFLKVDETMSLSDKEVSNARSSLGIGYANTVTAGLVTFANDATDDGWLAVTPHMMRTYTSTVTSRMDELEDTALVLSNSISAVQAVAAEVALFRDDAALAATESAASAAEAEAAQVRAERAAAKAESATEGAALLGRDNTFTESNTFAGQVVLEGPVSGDGMDKWYTEDAHATGAVLPSDKGTVDYMTGEGPAYPVSIPFTGLPSDDSIVVTGIRVRLEPAEEGASAVYPAIVLDREPSSRFTLAGLSAAFMASDKVQEGDEFCTLKPYPEGRTITVGTIKAATPFIAYNIDRDRFMDASKEFWGPAPRPALIRAVGSEELCLVGMAGDDIAVPAEVMLELDHKGALDHISDTDKAVAGLALSINDKFATTQALGDHAGDQASHVSAADRIRWDAAGGSQDGYLPTTGGMLTGPLEIGQGADTLVFHVKSALLRNVTLRFLSSLDGDTQAFATVTVYGDAENVTALLDAAPDLEASLVGTDTIEVKPSYQGTRLAGVTAVTDGMTAEDIAMLEAMGFEYIALGTMAGLCYKDVPQSASSLSLRLNGRDVYTSADDGTFPTATAGAVDGIAKVSQAVAHTQMVQAETLATVAESYMPVDKHVALYDGENTFSADNVFNAGLTAKKGVAIAQVAEATPSGMKLENVGGTLYWNGTEVGSGGGGAGGDVYADGDNVFTGSNAFAGRVTFDQPVALKEGTTLEGNGIVTSDMAVAYKDRDNTFTGLVEFQEQVQVVESSNLVIVSPADAYRIEGDNVYKYMTTNDVSVGVSDGDTYPVAGGAVYNAIKTHTQDLIVHTDIHNRYLYNAMANACTVHIETEGAGTTSSAYCRCIILGKAYCEPGFLRTVSVKARTASGTMPADIWLGLYAGSSGAPSGWRLVAKSINAITQVVGEWGTWYFDCPEINPEENLCLKPMLKDDTGWVDDSARNLSIQCWTSHSPFDEETWVRDGSNTARSWVPQVYLETLRKTPPIAPQDLRQQGVYLRDGYKYYVEASGVSFAFNYKLSRGAVVTLLLHYNTTTAISWSDRIRWVTSNGDVTTTEPQFVIGLVYHITFVEAGGYIMAYVGGMSQSPATA